MRAPSYESKDLTGQSTDLLGTAGQQELMLYVGRGHRRGWRIVEEPALLQVILAILGGTTITSRLPWLDVPPKDPEDDGPLMITGQGEDASLELATVLGVPTKHIARGILGGSGMDDLLEALVLPHAVPSILPPRAIRILL